MLRIVLGNFASSIFGLQLFRFGFERLGLNRDKMDLEFALQEIWLLAPLGASVIGYCLALLAPSHENRYLKTLGKLKFLFDSMLALTVITSLKTSLAVFKLLDRGCFELLGPYGLSQTLLANAVRLRMGPRRIYVLTALSTILGLILILSF